MSEGRLIILFQMGLLHLCLHCLDFHTFDNLGVAGASKRQMLRMAAEVADGTMMSDMTLHYIRDVIGIAREASAILGGKFLWKEPVVPSPSRGVEHVPLTVKVSAPKLCTRVRLKKPGITSTLSCSANRDRTTAFAA